MTSLLRLLATLTLILAGVLPVRADDRVTIFAAASMRGALEAVLAGQGGPVTVSYGGSGTMARQVVQGAPADLVILANVTWMNWLDEQGALETGARRDLLGNRLVVIAPVDATLSGAAGIEDLLTRLGEGRLAVGHTTGVPAGIYARQWLERAGLWAQVAPRLAETENVRAALALVSRGEAPLGVVYASDALADPGVRVVHEIDPALHDPIVYPMAIVSGRDTPAVRAVFEHLSGAQAAELFRDHGFALPAGGS